MKTDLSYNPTAFETERTRFASFAAKEAEPGLRDVFADLYRHWAQWSKEYFEHLREPHLTFGIVGPRRWGFAKPITDWGALTQITIKRNLLNGASPLLHGWSHEGCKRFIRDIFLHELIHAWQYEVAKKPEPGYRGHGPTFASKCNDIGEMLGLQPVIPRRRGRKDHGKPVCNYWPHNVRSSDYYLGAYEREADLGFRADKPEHRPSWIAAFENILELVEAGRLSELKQVLLDELSKERRRTAETAWRDLANQLAIRD